MATKMRLDNKANVQEENQKSRQSRRAWVSCTSVSHSYVDLNDCPDCPRHPSKEEQNTPVLDSHALTRSTCSSSKVWALHSRGTGGKHAKLVPAHVALPKG